LYRRAIARLYLLQFSKMNLKQNDIQRYE